MVEFVQIQRIRKSEYYARILELNEKKKQRFRDPQLPLDLLSKKLGDRLATKADVPVPECTACGLCCLFALIVPVSFSHSERLTEYMDILLDVPAESEIVVERVLPRNNDGRCKNLGGRLGESIGCTIYEDRPQVCHDFEAGSDRCHEYRRMFGLEPRLSDTEVKAAVRRLRSRKIPDVIEDVSIVWTGSIERTSYSIGNGSVERSTAEQLTIVAFLSDETPHELHTFEYGRERWLESDLLGLTLDEAKAKIAVQSGL